MSSLLLLRSLYVGLELSFQLFQASAAYAQSSSNSASNLPGMHSENGALGMVINWNQEGRLLVTKIVPEGPAARAGIAVGDRLISIDGQIIQGLPAAAVFSRILGPVGSTALLNLNSPERGDYEAKLTRVSVDSLNKSASFNVGWQPATGSAASPAAGSENTSSANTSSAAANSANTSSAATTGKNNSVNWKKYDDGDAGFSLDYPNGWTVEQDSKTGRIEIKSPQKSSLSIFPFFLPKQSLNIEQSQGLFQAMLKQYAPGPQWSKPATVAGGLRAISKSNNINSIAGLALSNMQSGTDGRLIIFQVPDDPNAASELTVLAQILQSLNIAGLSRQNASDSETELSTAPARGSGTDNSAAAALPYQNIEWTKFVDPNFASFSLDVPAGWNLSGGMEKPVAVDLRPWVKAISPDEKICVFIGDGSIEPRYLPANWLTWLGCPPGSTYKHSTGLVSKVLYYQPADKFVKQYAEGRFGKACDRFQLVNLEQLPDLARSINGTQGVVASDAASARYEFSAKGQDGEAFFLAATKKGQTMWWVSQICGVVASNGYQQQALDIFLRMYKSWQYSTDWSQAQNNQNAQFTQNWIATDRAARARSAAAFQSRIAAMDARHSAFMSRMASMDAAHERYMSGMRSSDRAHSNFINYIHDEDTLMNPDTGTKYQVEYGPRYHWMNSAGDKVLGTDSAWSPGADWTELVTPPR